MGTLEAGQGLLWTGRGKGGGRKGGKGGEGGTPATTKVPPKNGPKAGFDFRV